jgi:uncharacterized membrane protein YgcG
MQHLTKRVLMLPLAVVLWWAVPTSAQPEVLDQARMFSAEAIKKANEQIAELYRATKVELVIETFPEVPADHKAKLAALGEKKFFQSWAEERAKERRVEGVYILLCRNPGKLQYHVDARMASKGFTPAKGEAMAQTMLAKLREKKFDAALLAATSAVSDAVAKPAAAAQPDAAPKPKPAPAPAAPARDQQAAEEGSGWTWILYGGLALIVLWIIFGMMRGSSRPQAQAGYPPPGYGPPVQGQPGYGQPGYGPAGYPQPQGGGFMRSMLGGMLGAAGGMWAYNHLFGGQQAHGGPTGGPPPAPPAGDAFTGGGDFGGGGDFSGGADFGGGDFGGGDFGGGDFGGGGDF